MEFVAAVLLVTRLPAVEANASILQWNQTQCKTVEDAACYFPFEFDDVWYYGCVAVTKKKPWCYYSEPDDFISRWEYCHKDCPTGKPEFLQDTQIESFESDQLLLSCSVGGSPNPVLEWHGTLANDSTVIITTAPEPQDRLPKLITLRLQLDNGHLYKEVWCRAENVEGKAWSTPVYFNITGNGSSTYHATDNEISKSSSCESILGVRMYILIGVIGLLVILVAILLISLGRLKKKNRIVQPESQIPSTVYNKTGERSIGKKVQYPEHFSSKEDSTLVTNNMYISTEDQMYYELPNGAEENHMYSVIQAKDDKSKERANRTKEVELIENELYGNTSVAGEQDKARANTATDAEITNDQLYGNISMTEDGNSMKDNRARDIELMDNQLYGNV